MFFLIRELAGWVLLLCALYLISISVRYVGDRQVVEAGVLVAASLLVMRAGMLLIRMSMAARICQQSEQPDVVRGTNRPQ